MELNDTKARNRDKASREYPGPWVGCGHRGQDHPKPSAPVTHQGTNSAPATSPGWLDETMAQGCAGPQRSSRRQGVAGMLRRGQTLKDPAVRRVCKPLPTPGSLAVL